MENPKKYIIAWDPNLDTGISWIDEQHKRLLKHIEELLNGIINKENSTNISELLKFLTDYANNHFATEERFMRKYHYTEHDAQHGQHEEFINMIKKFDRRYEARGATGNIVLDIEKKLWNWYKGHILKYDMEFGRFLKRKGHVN
jgi:hemerythrin